MQRYNPYFEMKYNPRTNVLKMTPEIFKMWIETFKEFSPEQEEHIYKAFEFFTRKEK